MKIGIFFSLTNYGGVQTCVISLIKSLNKINIVPVLITDEEINVEIVKENCLLVEVYYVKFSISKKFKYFLHSHLKGAIDLVYYFRTKWLCVNFDFLYIFQPNIIVDSSCNYLYYLSMSPRSIGFSGHNIRSSVKFFIYDWIVKFFIPVYEFRSISKNCVINSKFTQNLFFKAYGVYLDVVYPSCQIQTPKSSNFYDRKYIVFLSRIIPEKRPDMVIKLAKNFPNLPFLIMGSSGDCVYLNFLLGLIKKNNILNVKILPNLSTDNMNRILKRSSIYFFPAINEHFGITTVEAMNNGVIPFVHDSGGQREIVPWDDFRFNDDNFIKKFQSILDLDDKKILEWRKACVHQASRFSENFFTEKMLSYLDLPK